MTTIDEELDKIVGNPASIELAEYELSVALREQGVVPAVYAKLTPEAKQAIKQLVEGAVAERVAKERLAYDIQISRLKDELEPYRAFRAALSSGDGEGEQ